MISKERIKIVHQLEKDTLQGSLLKSGNLVCSEAFNVSDTTYVAGILRHLSKPSFL